jgi:hypothetical protein
LHPITPRCLFSTSILQKKGVVKHNASLREE